MDINTSFWGFKDVIDPVIRVTLGDYNQVTEVKKDTTNPEFNETIYLPCTVPSMVQYIKLELMTLQLDGNMVPLATELLSLHFLDTNKIYGQF